MPNLSSKLLSDEYSRILNSLKLKSMFLLATLILVNGTANSQQGEKYMYLTLTDQQHGMSVRAGDSDEERLHHLSSKMVRDGTPEDKAKTADAASWKFVPVGDGYYYIIDRLRGKAMIAGDRADNNVHHQPHNDRENAKWRLVPMDKTGKLFQLIDAKHGLALVANSDFHRGGLYHQAPAGRSTAIWRLDPVTSEGIAPKEFVLSEDLTNTVFHTERKQIIGTPEKIILQASESNGTNGVMTAVLKDEETRTSEESWSLTHSVSSKIMAKISASISSKFGFGKVTVGVEAGTEQERSTEDTKGGSKSVEHKHSLENTISIEPGESVSCCLVTEISRSNIPFTANTKRLFGDGSTETIKRDGVFEGVIFTQGSVSCVSGLTHTCSMGESSSTTQASNSAQSYD